MDNRYVERRAHIEKRFIKENLIGNEKKVDISPSGKFSIEIQYYSTGEGTWNYSRGIIKECENNDIIADIKRNYSSFWHAWIDHDDGNEYLLCGEDYQGYSAINLNSGEHHIHFPESAYNGGGFCWVDAYPSPSGNKIAVYGCYWAAPFEIVIYDFNIPQDLPFTELHRESDIYDFDEWVDDEEFLIQKSIEID